MKVRPNWKQYSTEWQNSMHFKEGKNKGDKSVELGKKKQRTEQKPVFWQKINSKTEDWTVFVRSYCTMAEGNKKHAHFFIVLLWSLLSANSGSPHLRNSFYVTSQKSPCCIRWHSLRKHASNQKGIRQKACKRVQIWGEGWKQHQAGSSLRYSGKQNVRKDCYQILFYLQRCSESLRTHSSDDSRSFQRHSVVCVLWPAESKKRNLPFCPDSSIHSASSTPPVHKWPISKEQTEWLDIIILLWNYFTGISQCYH